MNKLIEFINWVKNSEHVYSKLIKYKSHNKYNKQQHNKYNKQH